MELSQRISILMETEIDSACQRFQLYGLAIPLLVDILLPLESMGTMSVQV